VGGSLLSPSQSVRESFGDHAVGAIVNCIYGETTLSTLYICPRAPLAPGRIGPSRFAYGPAVSSDQHKCSQRMCIHTGREGSVMISNETWR
jgi:hypothetical protein